MRGRWQRWRGRKCVLRPESLTVILKGVPTFSSTHHQGQYTHCPSNTHARCPSIQHRRLGGGVTRFVCVLLVQNRLIPLPTQIWFLVRGSLASCLACCLILQWTIQKVVNSQNPRLTELEKSYLCVIVSVIVAWWREIILMVAEGPAVSEPLTEISHRCWIRIIPLPRDWARDSLWTASSTQ